MNQLFRPYNIEEIINNIKKPQQDIHVLEFGMGEGRALMQLRKEFPEIEIHGINKGRWTKGDNLEWIKETGRYYDIFNAAEINKIKAPVLHFFDANDGNLPLFPDNYFDLIISQVSVGYIDRKDILIEEFWRILRPNGIALLDLDKFVVMNSGNSLSNSDFFAKLGREGFEVKVGKNEFDYLYMRKNVQKRLDLKLTSTHPSFPVFIDTRDLRSK